jgi:hypothetical protein
MPRGRCRVARVSNHEVGASVEPSGRRISATRIRIARVIAVAADAVQIGLLPVFGPGALSFVNDGLDVVVGVSLMILVGWHFAFLPTFVAELIPGVDLIPTWTVAVWFATRDRKIESGGGAIQK